MTFDCDELLTTLVLGGTLDDAGAAHVAGCPRCAAEAGPAAAVARAFVAACVPEPPPGLSARVLSAAAPLLAHARRTSWRFLARVVAVALLPLPLLVAVNVVVLRALYRVLTLVLPGAVSAYLVFNYVVVLALLLGLTYAAIPLLAERQTRLREEDAV